MSGNNIELLLGRAAFTIILLFCVYRVSKLNISDLIKVLFSEIRGLAGGRFSEIGTINLVIVLLVSSIVMGWMFLDKVGAIVMLIKMSEPGTSPPQKDPGVLFLSVFIIGSIGICSAWMVSSLKPGGRK